MADLDIRIDRLWVHPVKSCAGFSPERARLTEAGLEHDRRWMLVDRDDEFLSQRELARMALVRPLPAPQGLYVEAPGAPALFIPDPGADAPRRRVRIWNDELEARDAGDAAAAWFGAVLGTPVRLVCFDDAARRLSNRRWTGTIEAPNRFSDGFPLLLVSRAAIDALNRRLAAGFLPPLDERRFRPNLVLEGLEAHDEDRLAAIRLDTPAGVVELRPVKPCTRCPIPNIDPDTAIASDQPGDALTRYRSDPRLGGAITFGMNAVVVAGAGAMLARGMTGSADFAF